MKQPIRYFSIGLLTSSVILLLAFYFFDNGTVSTDNLSVEEMTETLKADGYHVVTEKEFISLSVNDEDESKTDSTVDNDQKKENTDKKQEEKTDKKTYTINIKSGMLPSEISEILAENDIIKDADKFDQYLEKEEYSKYIQLGKHKLNSEMSTEEVAEALTK